MKYLLKGGTVVSGKECRKLDILIDNEKIAAIGDDLSFDGAEYIDVAGKLLFPGFIDAHTHFDLEVAGTVTIDDFTSGTRAALAGGTTAIIDFATQYKGESLRKALANWHDKAKGKSSCDYGFHMSVSDWNEKVSEELSEMMDSGVTSFKLYMTYDAMKVNDKEIYQILKRLKSLGGIAGVHCENSGIIEAMVEDEKSLGHMSVASHPVTRPVQAEAEAVNRLLRIAGILNTPVIIVHLTNCEAMRAVEEARARGQKVYVETCPQYLLLDDSLYRLPFFESSKYVIAPPLRTKADQQYLWQMLKNDQIQTVSTDHCSFTTAQKAMGIEDFTKIPGGMPGVETRGVLLYSCGVMTDRITLPQMCRLLSENPAKLYGLFPQKGCLMPGSDADIVIYDPEGSDTIRAAALVQRSDYAPYEGMTVYGRIDSVFLRGQLVVDRTGNIVANSGRYISRNKCSL
jgi:dihydropyrimidinase